MLSHDLRVNGVGIDAQHAPERLPQTSRIQHSARPHDTRRRESGRLRHDPRQDIDRIADHHDGAGASR